MWSLVRVIAALRGSNNENVAILQRLYGGGTEETWGGDCSSATLSTMGITWWQFGMMLRFHAEMPASKWVTAVMLMPVTKMKQRQRYIKERTLGKTLSWNDNASQNLGIFLLHILFQLTSSAHILLCSWIVGWKQVVCQYEHEKEHLLWTYNALGRVRIALYRGNDRYFVLHF